MRFSNLFSFGFFSFKPRHVACIGFWYMHVRVLTGGVDGCVWCGIFNQSVMLRCRAGGRGYGFDMLAVGERLLSVRVGESRGFVVFVLLGSVGLIA